MEPETDSQPLSVKDTVDSKFRYVLLVAERAEQIMQGGRLKLDARPEDLKEKHTRLAQMEIDQELVEWDYGPAPEAAAAAAAAAAEEEESAAADDEAAEAAPEDDGDDDEAN